MSKPESVLKIKFIIKVWTLVKPRLYVQTLQLVVNIQLIFIEFTEIA